LHTVVPLTLSLPLKFYKLDLYGTGSFRIVLFVCLGNGGLRAGLSHQHHARGAGLITPDTLRRYFAPVSEKSSALILIYLVRRPFTYFVDGAIYGFAIGVGFAIIENYSYIFGNTTSMLGQPSPVCSRRT